MFTTIPALSLYTRCKDAHRQHVNQLTLYERGLSLYVIILVIHYYFAPQSVLESVKSLIRGPTSFGKGGVRFLSHRSGFTLLLIQISGLLVRTIRRP